MVTINFFMKHRHIYTKNYSYETEIKQLKYDISNFIKIPEEFLQILRWHVFVEDCKTVEYLEPDPGRELDIVVINTSSLVPPILEDNIVPDIITVTVEHEDYVKEITVEIEDRSISKPYLGGYKHIDSDVEYHHAATQSGPPAPRVEPMNKNHRDSQTIIYKNRTILQNYCRGTQMSNERVWIPTVTDIIKSPGTYETAEEREIRLNVIGKVRTIQRYFRAYKMRQALHMLHLEYVRRRRNMEDEAREITDDCEMLKIWEINAKTFPRTRDDFGMLYSMVDRWKKAQLDKIIRNCSGAAKLAEMYLLLDKEIEMLASIEKHRQKIKQEMKDIKVMEFFKYISTPKKWKSYKNIKVSMDTLENQKGRIYRSIYYDCCNHQVSNEERLIFIKNLKDSLKDHNCQIANQLVSLLSQEEELLHHNFDDNSLEFLRKRIEQMLLKHMQIPECNEGVTRRMLKLKQREYEQNSTYCPRCSKIKSNKDFPPINSRNLALKSCTSCTWYDRVQEPWFEVAPYRLILRQIRRDERKRNNYTSIAYIVQEKDIHYIIQRIWHAKSMISETTNLNELRLCRWKRDEEWSPWNTILLTEQEMIAHLNIEVLENVYDQDLMIAVMDKNLLGRVIFSNALFLKEHCEQEKEKEKKRMKEVMEREDDEPSFRSEDILSLGSTCDEKL